MSDNLCFTRLVTLTTIVLFELEEITVPDKMGQEIKYLLEKESILKKD